MNTPTRTMRILAVMVVVMVACSAPAGPRASPQGEDRRSAIELPSLDTVPSRGELVTGEVPDELLDSILAAAATETGTDPNDVTVVAAEEVTWSDGSLGCPEPGMVYTQALVPGYRVVVDAGGRALSFHASQDGGFVLCENPQPPSGGG